MNEPRLTVTLNTPGSWQTKSLFQLRVTDTAWGYDTTQNPQGGFRTYLTTRVPRT